MEANLNDVSMLTLHLFFSYFLLSIAILIISFQDCQNDTEVDEDFSFIQPFDLITKNVNQLRQIVQERRKGKQKEKESVEKEKDVKDKPIKRKLRKLIIDDDDEEEEKNVQNLPKGKFLEYLISV